jgi:hypothetical protein
VHLDLRPSLNRTTHIGTLAFAMRDTITPLVKGGNAKRWGRCLSRACGRIAYGLIEPRGRVRGVHGEQPASVGVRTAPGRICVSLSSTWISSPSRTLWSKARAIGVQAARMSTSIADDAR